MSFDSHQSRLKSCVRLGVGAWLFVRPIIPCFHLPSNVLFFVLQTKLGLPRPLIFGLTHYICWIPWGSASFVVPMVEKRLHPMMSFRMHLHPLQKMLSFISCGSKPMFFHHLLLSPFIGRSTLFCQWMAYRHWPMSLRTPFE